MATRKMGALDLKPGNPLVQIGAVAIGYFFAADPINDEIDKLLTKKNADGTSTPPTASTKKMIGIGTAGVGGFLVLKGKKTMVKTLAGGVLAGVGLKRSLKEFNIISGFQDVPVLGRMGEGVGFARGYAVNGRGINGGYAVNGNKQNAMQ